ncbi:hypothetical protein DL93DRAFT_2232873 [Clavulina sp. PMI_390]|nr:hypothetical protein DL93DRAFT_2232873 [Clavulina sp. PMI_390]
MTKALCNLSRLDTGSFGSPQPPILQLPPELLIAILSLNQQTAPSAHRDSCARTLSSVCRRWRSTVLGAHSFWRRYDIGWPGEYRTLIFQRSGTLDVEVVVPDDPALPWPLKDIPSLERWEKLRLTCLWTEDDPTHLANFTGSVPITSVHNFDLLCKGVLIDDRLRVPTPSVTDNLFEMFPNLRRLAILTNTASYLTLPPLSALNQLSSLRCNIRVTTNSFEALLANCAHLR